MIKEDEAWFTKFVAAGGLLSALKWLGNDEADLKQQRAAFLEGTQRNPVFRYTRARESELNRRTRALLGLHREIADTERREVVRELYHGLIYERLQMLELVRAAVRMQAEEFCRLSTSLYGKPERDMFDEALRAMAQDKMPAAGELTARDIAAAFDAALAARELHDWNTQIVSGEVVAIHVSNSARVIRVPASRKVTAAQLKGLVAHEVDTHVVRNVNGRAGRWHALRLGLPQYDKGEEGVAMVRQAQAQREAWEFVHPERYVAIGLAMGLDGVERDFRDVFEVLRTLGLDVDAAWRVSLRVFRGTDGATAGSCFTKDVIYQHGYRDVLRSMQERPGEVARWDAGKYDPSNMAHLELLDALGVEEVGA